MASIHKRVGASGATSWQVRFRTPDGAARARSFPLRRDASRYAREVETAQGDGGFVDPRAADVTVGAWVDTWLDGKTNLAATTRERYRGALDVWVRPRWGAMKLSDVRHDDVQMWLAGIDRQPATVRKVHRVLSQALDFAVRSGRLARNPAAGVSLPRVHVAEKRYLSHAQVDALAREVGPEWRLVVYTLAYTGLRWGELAALRVSSLDLLRDRLHVVESATPVRGRIVFGPPKTHERREVPLVPFLAEMLGEAVDGLASRELVFAGPAGGVLRASAFRARALTPAAEELGLCVPKLDARGAPVLDRLGRPTFTGHFHPHEFRHTAASLAIAAGADVKVVQRMLGHRSAAMTLDRYGHLFPDRLDTVAAAMDAARSAALA